MPDNSCDDLKASAAAAISRLAVLTYQQKQMVASGQLLPVLDEVIRKRRILTVLITLACIWLLFQSSRSVFVQNPSIFSICLFAIAAYWLYRRLCLQRQVAATVRQYQSSLPEGDSNSSSLAAYLKQNHRLTYDQHQSLKLGNAVRVATELAATRRRNANSMILGALASSLVIQFVDLVLHGKSNQSDSLMVQDVFAQLAACGLIVVCACGCSVRERMVARRLDQQIALESPEPGHAAKQR